MNDKIRILVSKLSVLNFVLAVVIVSVIIGIVIISSVYLVYLKNSSSISISNFQSLAIFSSIIVPITFLLFVDLIKQSFWKEFKYNRIITIVIAIFMALSAYLVFGGASVGLVSPSQGASLLYSGASVSTLILITLLTLFVALY